MSRAEANTIKLYIHALDQRVARLERALVIGGFMLGVVPTALQLYHMSGSTCP
jgi:hypothetical protein